MSGNFWDSMNAFLSSFEKLISIIKPGDIKDWYSMRSFRQYKRNRANKYIQIRSMLALHSPMMLSQLSILMDMEEDILKEYLYKPMCFLFVKYLKKKNKVKLRVSKYQIRHLRNKIVNRWVKYLNSIHNYGDISKNLSIEKSYESLYWAADSFLIYTANASNVVKEEQKRCIIDNICAQMTAVKNLESIMRNLLILAQKKRREEHRNTAIVVSNVLNLSIQRGLDITKFPLRDLDIGIVSFERTILKDADFSNSDIQRAIFSERFDAVCSCTFSPDGKYVAMGGMCDGSIIILNVENRSIICRKEDISNYCGIRTLFFQTSNGQTCLAGYGSTGTFVTYRFEKDEKDVLSLLRLKENREDNLTCMCNYGDLIATAGMAGKIYFYDFKCNDLSVVHSNKRTTYHSIAFSKDGKYLVAGRSDGVCEVFSVENNQVKWENNCPESKAACDNVEVTSIFFLDNTILFTGNKNGILRKYSFSEGKLTYLKEWTCHNKKSITHIDEYNGKCILTSGEDGCFIEWDAKKIRSDKDINGIPLKLKHKGGITDFCCKGTLLFSCGMDNRVRLYDALDKEAFSIKGVSRWVNSIIFLPNDYLACAYADGKVRLWNIVGEAFYRDDCTHEAEHETEIISLATSSGYRYLLSGSRDGSLYLVDRYNTENSGSVSIDGEKKLEKIRKIISFHNTGTFCVAANSGGIRYFELDENGKLNYVEEVPSSFIDWLGDAAYMSVAEENKGMAVFSIFEDQKFSLKIYDVDYKRKPVFHDIIRLLIPNKTRVQSIAISYDKKLLVAAGDDLTIYAWSIPDTWDSKEKWKRNVKPKSIQILPNSWNPAYHRHIGSVSFCPDPDNFSVMALVGGDGNIRFYDFKLNDGKGDFCDIHAEFLQNNKQVSYDNQNHFSKNISCSKYSLHTVAFSPDGKKVATGGTEGKIVIFDFAYDEGKAHLQNRKEIQYDMYQNAKFTVPDSALKRNLEELGAKCECLKS